MTRDEIIAAARACLGTPFAHQGRVPGVGLDCAGLLVIVARQLGIEPIDVPGYGRRPHRGLLEETLEQNTALQRIPLANRQPGDVLLMRFVKEPQHLAIDAGATIIHSYEASGKVCEHGMDAVWEKRLIAAYRFVGVEA